MRCTRQAVLAGVALLTPVFFAACQRSAESDAEPEMKLPPAEAEAMDGLSREEISRQVQPLSPEKAHELGIIDTTVKIENPPPGSRVIPGTGQEVGPGDTL